MSHTTTIKALAIKDARAIERAAEELQRQGVNCRLERDARPRMYYTRQEEQCDYVLRLDGAVYNGKTYDVGFKLQNDGTYKIILDEWGQAVTKQIGAACALPQSSEDRALHAIGRFAQQYGRFAAIHQANAQGYVVENDWIDEDGNVQLELNVMSY